MTQQDRLAELAQGLAARRYRTGRRTCSTRRWLLVQGAGVTVLLSCLSFPLAMVLGLLVALGRLYAPRWLAVPLTAYVELLRGTPVLLQLYVIYYLCCPRAGVYLPGFWAGVLGLAINYSAYEAENYRARPPGHPQGQMEAALALGMSRGRPCGASSSRRRCASSSRR